MNDSIEFTENDEIIGTEESEDGFLDLEDLLNESLAASGEAAAVAKAREMLKKKGASLEEARVKELKEKILSWEIKNTWDIRANVTLWTRQTCSCGSEHKIYAGMFQHQILRANPSTKRWIKVSSAFSNFSNEVIFQDAQIQMCEVCAEGKGWDLEKGEQKILIIEVI